MCVRGDIMTHAQILEFNTAVGNNIRYFRELAGLSHKELAHLLRLGGHLIPASYLCRIESGRSSIYAYDILILATAFGVSCDQLLFSPEFF